MDMISDFAVAVLLFALEAALRFDLHGILCAHFFLLRPTNLLRRWHYVLATPDLPVLPLHYHVGWQWSSKQARINLPTLRNVHPVHRSLYDAPHCPVLYRYGNVAPYQRP